MSSRGKAAFGAATPSYDGLGNGPVERKDAGAADCSGASVEDRRTGEDRLPPVDASFLLDLKFLERNAQVLATPFTVGSILQMEGVELPEKRRILESIPRRTLVTCLKRVSKKAGNSRQLFLGRKSRRAMALHLEAIRQESASEMAATSSTPGDTAPRVSSSTRTRESTTSAAAAGSLGRSGRWKLESLPTVWPDEEMEGMPSSAELKERYAVLRKEVADLAAQLDRKRARAARTREVAGMLREISLPDVKANMGAVGSELARHLEESRALVASIREILDRSVCRHPDGERLLQHCVAVEFGLDDADRPGQPALIGGLQAPDASVEAAIGLMSASLSASARPPGTSVAGRLAPAS